MPSSIAASNASGTQPVRSSSHDRPTSSNPIDIATESFAYSDTRASRRTLPASPARSRFDVVEGGQQEVTGQDRHEDVGVEGCNELRHQS